MRVVHMAPGPTPTFTMSAPASRMSATPSLRNHVSCDDRAVVDHRTDLLQCFDHATLVTVGGIHHENVHPYLDELLGSGACVATYPHCGPDQQPAAAVNRRMVEIGPYGTLLGDDAHQAS